MKTFKVFRRPSRGFQTVKCGFSWPAFAFGVLWLLAKRLWMYAALWTLAYAMLSFVEQAARESSDPAFQGVLMLGLAAGRFGLWILPGFTGNAWWADSLTARGHELVITVDAATADAAVAQAIKTIGSEDVERLMAQMESAEPGRVDVKHPPAPPS